MLALAVALAGACDDGDGSEANGGGRQAAVVETVIRTVALDGAPGDAGDPDAMPIVFVVGADDVVIPIGVQADVVAALVDDADVRFADGRSEVVDDEVEIAPVREGGVLVAIGAIADDELRTVDVDVERYVSIDDRSDLVVSLRWDDPDWVVSSTVVVPDPAG